MDKNRKVLRFIILIVLLICTVFLVYSIVKQPDSPDKIVLPLFHVNHAYVIPTIHITKAKTPIIAPYIFLFSISILLYSIRIPYLDKKCNYILSIYIKYDKIHIEVYYV